MTFFTADQHFFHHNMLLFRTFKGDAQRPFRTTDEMHRVMMKNYNEIVTDADIVYHLGDFAYGPGAKSWQSVRDIISRLKGQHHLILGNHDHIKPFDYLEAGFLSVHTSLVLEDTWDGRETVLVHDPAVAGVLKDKNFIHGHTHSLGVHLNKNTFCVCVELHDYKPVPITDIRFGV